MFYVLLLFFRYYRYKILDRLDQERRVILFQHLGFMHCPIREHCPFHQNCIDNLLDELLMGDKTTQTTTNLTNTTTVGSGSGTTTTTTTTLASINHKNHYKTSINNWKSATISNTTSGNDKTLNLLIVGSEHLASDLLNDVRMCTGSKGEYIYENQTYYLNYRIANGDMEAFKAIDVYSSGKNNYFFLHQKQLKFNILIIN